MTLWYRGTDRTEAQRIVAARELPKDRWITSSIGKAWEWATTYSDPTVVTMTFEPNLIPGTLEPRSRDLVAMANCPLLSAEIVP
jgi:hypothetical protein